MFQCQERQSTCNILFHDLQMNSLRGYVATYIVAGDNLCRFCGTYCRLKAYIFARMIFLPCIYCCRLQYARHILLPHSVKRFLKDYNKQNVITRYLGRPQVYTWERERYIIILIEFKILKYHVCIYPNVDGPSRYDYKKI